MTVTRVDTSPRLHRCHHGRCRNEVACVSGPCPTTPGRVHVCSSCARSIRAKRGRRAAKDVEIADLRRQGGAAIEVSLRTLLGGGR